MSGFRWFRRAAPLAGLLALLLWPGAGARAADAFTPAQRAEIVQIVRQALKQDPSILRDAVAAMQQDDAAKQADAQAMAIAAQKAALLGPASPFAGNPAAKVTLIEFFDVRCPYCRQMEPDMAKLLAQDHDLRIIYKDLPILGPPSVLASRALLAAQRQGKYLPMRSLLMADPPQIDMAMVQAAAAKLGLDWPRLRKDMQSSAVSDQIRANLALARALKIDGTPAFVLGDTLIPGAIGMADLQQAIAAQRKAGG
ncbi:MAG: thioredoxin domain-containing protein [Rhodospirillales bacterium]|nr:thioredoxin domain-containing protein [Rhodospirillales bacterium]